MNWKETAIAAVIGAATTLLIIRFVPSVLPYVVAVPVTK